MTDSVDTRAERGRKILEARKLLGWSRVRLAAMAELTMTDVIYLEGGTAGGHARAFDAVLRALECLVPKAIRTLPTGLFRRLLDSNLLASSVESREITPSSCVRKVRIERR